MAALDTSPHVAEPGSETKASFSRNSSARLVAGMVTLAASQVAGIVVARGLGPEGKGLASLLALITAISVMLTDFGLTTSGVYFVGSRKYSSQDIVNTFLGFGLLTGGIAAVSLIVLQTPLAKALFDGKHASLLMVLALGVPIGLLYNWLSAVLRGQDRIIQVSVVNVTSTIFGLGVLLVLLYGFQIREPSIVWGANATLAYGFLATFIILKKQSVKFRIKLDSRLLKDSINYGLRGQVGQILQFINYRFDLLVVNAILGTASVGIYGVGAAVSQVIWQVPNALSYALYSKVSALSPEEGNRITVKVARRSLFLSFLVAVTLVPVGYLAIPLFFGKSFSPAVTAMWLLLPGVVFLSHYKVLGVHMAGQGHPEYYSYAAGMSAIVTLILDFVLIPRIGINGASIASSVAYTLSSTLCVYWFVKSTGMKNVSQLFIPQREDFKLKRKSTSKEK